MNFVFLILNYYTYDDTIKCIESINNIKYQKKDIVVVDNGSTNDSFDILKKKYQKYNNIHILNSKKNLGFANGNNLGFKYAKEKLNADFIIMCNSDTVILKENIIDQLLKIYEKEHYAVLGPKIILKDRTVNELYYKIPSIKVIKKQINYFRKMLIINYLHLENLYNLLKNKFKHNIVIDNEEDKNVIHKNIILHGCFLCFSPLYIEKFDGIDNRTFLYREEELLAIRLKINNLDSIYYPKIEILHNEYGSTTAVNKTSIKKNRFVYKNQLKSTKILLDEMIKLENVKK